MSETNGTPQALSELYQEAEKLWGGPINEMLGSEFFVKWLEMGRDAYLSQVEVSRDSLERYWEAVRLPHMSHIANLAGQVVNIESRIEDVGDRLDEISSRLADVVARLDARLEAQPRAAARTAKE